MANNALLYLSNSAQAPNVAQDSSLLLSNYLIPVLWLVMFNEGDINTHPWDDEEEDVYCVVPINEAIERIKSRKEIVQHFISNIQPYLNTWLSFLIKAEEKYSYIKIEISQIIDMDEAAMDETQKALQIWNSLNEENLSNFFKISCITDVYDNETNHVISKDSNKVNDYLFGYSLLETDVTLILKE